METEVEQPYDRQREEQARDLLRAWADAAADAGCPPAFVARMRTFADMHDRHAAEAPNASEDDDVVLSFLWRLRRAADGDRTWVQRIDDQIEKRRAEQPVTL